MNLSPSGSLALEAVPLGRAASEGFLECTASGTDLRSSEESSLEAIDEALDLLSGVDNSLVEPDELRLYGASGLLRRSSILALPGFSNSLWRKQQRSDLLPDQAIEIGSVDLRSRATSRPGDADVIDTARAVVVRMTTV